MGFRLLVAALALALTGCATGLPVFDLPKHPEPQSVGEVLANLKGDLPIDLDAATAIAVAHNDEIAAACYPALKRFFMETLATPTPSPDQVKGVFSAWEKARVERIALEGKAGVGVTFPTYLKLGCAAMVQDERNFGIRLAAMIAGAQIGMPGVSGLLPK
jgi:hypothetical protein